MAQTTIRGTRLFVPPPSGWVEGCEYGDPPKGKDRHYVCLCINGPLDGQYETFHGEAPGYFYKPKAGAYERIHEYHAHGGFGDDAEEAVFIWRGHSYRHWWDRLRARLRGEPIANDTDRRKNDDADAYLRAQRIRMGIVSVVGSTDAMKAEHE